MNKNGIFLLLSVFLFLMSCSDKDKEEIIIPFTAEITTLKPIYISNQYFETEFTITISSEFQGRSIEKGVLLNTSSTIDIETGKKGTSMSSLNNSGENQYKFNNLKKATKYYYRAYATDGTTVVYGAIESFTTTNESSPKIVRAYHGGTYNGFFVGMEVRNAELVAQTGAVISTDEWNYTTVNTSWYSTEVSERRNDMYFEYGYEGYPYNKGTKIFKRPYIKTKTGETIYGNWSYFYVP